MNCSMILLAAALYAGPGLGGAQPSAPQGEQVASGSFDVQITPVDEEAFAGGHELGRYNLTKQYQGGLEATAEGEMLTALTAVEGSGGYVAIERVVGSLDGRSGSFVLQHSGTMAGGSQTLTITVVPDSGTEELEGLIGTLGVEILEDGRHLYEFRYSFPGQVQGRPSPTTPSIEEAAMQAIKHADTEIILTRAFAAAPTSVFDALTQPEHLLHWMQPAAVELVECEADVRAGGSYHHVYQRPSGAKIEVRGRYTEVNAPHRFAFTEGYDFSPLEIEVTVDLHETEGETVFRQTLRYATKEQRDRDFDGVAGSARETYPKLDRYLAELGRQ